jgi:hypothetical protein
VTEPPTDDYDYNDRLFDRYQADIVRLAVLANSSTGCCGFPKTWSESSSAS